MSVHPSQLIIDRYELTGKALQILFILFVMGQLTYLANVLLGLFTKSNSTAANKQ
jgi:hypothetical protein